MKLYRGRRQAGQHRSRGQAIVEFALVVPLFILLLAGMVDFGMGLYSYMTLINSARDGARLGATACAAGPCAAAVTARVTAAAGGLAPAVTVVCTNPGGGAVNCASASASHGDTVSVTARYTYRMVWPLTFGTQIDLTSSAKFMVE